MTNVADLGQVVYKPTSDLRLSDDNPRRIPQAAVDLLAKSLTEFGWQQPIVVNPANEVLAGHTRLRAARQLGLAAVPVVVADRLTAEQARAYRITDNRTGDYSTWDLPLLVEQLEPLAAEFSDVLGLADWEALVGEFEDMISAGTDDLAALDPGPTPGPTPEPAPGGGFHDPDPAPPLPTGPAATLTTGPPLAAGASSTDLDVSDVVRGHIDSFEVTVCFRTKADADAAGPTLIDLPGAVDVRYKR